MESYLIRMSSLFNRLLIVSIAGHMLLFYVVYFTFNNSLVTTPAIAVSFLGSFLGKSDLNLSPGSSGKQHLHNNFKTKISLVEFKTPPTSNSLKTLSFDYLSFNSFKPLQPIKAMQSQTKQLNKFLVEERKSKIQASVKQPQFEPKKWERIELKLKVE